MAIIKEVTSFPQIKVQIVTSFPDLYVYVTKNKSEAKNSDCIWFFSNSTSDKKIQFVKSFSDLKIQYVKNKSAAGWKNKTHKLQNQIGWSLFPILKIEFEKDYFSIRMYKIRLAVNIST